MILANKNISTIDLGSCEKRLKYIYEIDQSLPLIIFKIDYFSPDTKIPIIGYEVYHPINKSKLNLSYCEDILIKLNIPVSINENELYKYDPNSQFYKDNCFPYTTEDGTDILLIDRKQEFNDNNLSLCENNCNYTGYNEDNKQSLCDCNIKNKMELISEIIDNPNKLSNNFDSKSSSSGNANIISIKCTKALFSKEGLKNNISSYILIIFITHFLISILLFMKCGYPLLNQKINDILTEKKKIHKQIKENNQIINNNKAQNKKMNNINQKIVNIPPKKHQIKINKINNNINAMKLNNKNKKSKSQIKNSNKNVRNPRRSLSVLTRMNKNKKKIIIIYNDFELNSFDYNKAILYDKRTCFQYYSYLIRTKNLILFSFCPIKDYNSMIIKSCIFSLSFSIYYAINFAFFDNNIMHKIYEIGGKYDFIYFLPKIIISFIVSYYATVIIKIIFLSERYIIQIKSQPILSVAYNISDKVKRNLFIKYTLFFILGLIFLVFFWILLSSFGAVYLNTQIFIFKNTIISFGISLVYPIFIAIFPTFFRMIALNSQEKNNDYAYTTSKVLQML